MATDTFDSSIDAGWINSVGLLGSLQWVSGGTVEATSTGVDSAMLRTGSFTRAQFSEAVVDTLDTSATFAQFSVTVLQSAVDGSAYVAACTVAEAFATRYALERYNSDGSWTSLASGGEVRSTVPPGTIMRLEVDDEGNLTFSTDEGSGMTVRLTATDTALTSGAPGVLTYRAASGSVARITSWNGGNAGGGGGSIKRWPSQMQGGMRSLTGGMQ